MVDDGATMSYRARPYIPFLPMIPNPLKAYSIEDGRLCVRVFGQVTHEVPLATLSVTKPPGVGQLLMHKWLDRGDLIVSDSGGRMYRLNRVIGISSFRAAIADALKSAAPKEPPGLPWYVGLHTAADVVVLPACPEEFKDWLYCARYGGGHTPDTVFAGLNDDFLVREGDWVKKGQEVAIAAGSKVLSPVDGCVAAISWEVRSWRWCTDTHWTEKPYAESFLIAIHPVQGCRAEGLEYAFDPLIKRVRAALDSPGYKAEFCYKMRIADPQQQELAVKRSRSALDEVVASMRACGVRIRSIKNGKLV